MKSLSLSLTLLLGSVAIVATSPQRPIVLVPDRLAPPATLREMWAGVPVILRVEILKSDVKAVPAHGTPVVITDHSARVLEVFKDDGSIGRRRIVDISQPAGTIVVDGQEITTYSPDLPVFSRGQEVVVFLDRSERTGGYKIAYGPPGGYVFAGENVTIPRPVRNHDFATGRAQLPKTEFLNRLRQLRDKRQ